MMVDGWMDGSSVRHAAGNIDVNISEVMSIQQPPKSSSKSTVFPDDRHGEGKLEQG